MIIVFLNRHATSEDRHILKIVKDNSQRCNSYVGFQNKTTQIRIRFEKACSCVTEKKRNRGQMNLTTIRSKYSEKRQII